MRALAAFSTGLEICVDVPDLGATEVESIFQVESGGAMCTGFGVVNELEEARCTNP